MSDRSLALQIPMNAGNMSTHERDVLGQFCESLYRTGQLDVSARLDTLRTILSAMLNELGFKYFAYHVARSSSVGGSGRLPYMISNYPESWVKHYVREHYLDDDPIVGRFLRDRRPFLWSQIGDSEELNSRQRRLFDEARDAGVAGGFTVPIHSRGDVAALSAVPDGGCEDEREAIIGRYQQLLRLIALPYHLAACGPLLEKSLTGDSARRRSLLSPREKQVLEWTAKGKSTWEISVVLGISEKSVEFHMEGAKRKLQVFNRTHAVAKAIMLDLLSLA